jgi:hypothetical protein
MTGGGRVLIEKGGYVPNCAGTTAHPPKASGVSRSQNRNRNSHLEDQMTLKLCKDCRFLQTPPNTNPHCLHNPILVEEALERGPPDYVFGTHNNSDSFRSIAHPGTIPAQVCRENVNRCGPNAEWFEPEPETIADSFFGPPITDAMIEAGQVQLDHIGHISELSDEDLKTVYLVMRAKERDTEDF